MSGLRTGGLLIAVLATGILVAPAAQAKLLEVDLNTPGDALVTRDTDTGLDWLDLTESIGLSFDQVEADVGGFISDGWRHATGAEVCALFAAADAEPSPCPGGFVNSFGALTLKSLLGQTFHFANDHSAFGLYDDGDPSGPGGVGFAQASIGLGSSATSVRDDQRGSNLASSTEGNFLVRPSPVSMPIGPYSRAALVILLALPGLVMVGRRSFTS